MSMYLLRKYPKSANTISWLGSASNCYFIRDCAQRSHLERLHASCRSGGPYLGADYVCPFQPLCHGKRIRRGRPLCEDSSVLHICTRRTSPSRAFKRDVQRDTLHYRDEVPHASLLEEKGAPLMRSCVRRTTLFLRRPSPEIEAGQLVSSLAPSGEREELHR